MITNKEIRSTGREYLRGNYKMAVINLLLLGVANSTLQSIVRSLTGESALNMKWEGQTLPTIDTILSMDFSSFQTSLNILLSIVVGLVIAAMHMGNDWGYLDMLDGVPLSSAHLIRPFDKNIWKTFGLLALQAIYIFLWAILLVIPGIMKFYSLALANFIYFDNPSMKTADIIHQSEAYMKGKKWKLFQLDLSYVWIYLIPLAIFMGFVFSLIGLAFVSYSDNPAPDAGMGQFVFLLLVIVLALAAFAILTFIIEPRRKAARAVFYSEVFHDESGSTAGRRTGEPDKYDITETEK